MMCFREAPSTLWKHIEDVLPLWGCTSYAHQRCVTQRAAHHRCVPFHKVVAHLRCVSAKRLHIEDVQPLWGCTSYAHQRCASASQAEALAHL
jgi:hypothetical protein